MRNGFFRAITAIASISKGTAGARSKPRGLRTQVDYAPLEKKQLLATISNAGFEAPGDYSGLDAAETVQGWQTFPDANGASLVDVVETRALGNVLKVDSRAGHFDRIFQDVSVEAGQEYLLQFDIVGNRDGTDRSDQVNVVWDGRFVGGFRGLNFIQTVAVEVVAPSDGFSRLEFREAFDAAGGDGQGSVSYTHLTLPTKRIV